MKAAILDGCRRVSDEVYYAVKSPFVVTSSLVSALCEIAAFNQSGKVRICFHASPDDTVHDMLIALDSKADIRPHSHRVKAESFQVLEGALKVIFYDEMGIPTQSIKLVAAGAEKDNLETSFYCRIPAGLIHTVVPQTDSVVFREVTDGPFKPKDTIYPDWADIGKFK